MKSLKERMNLHAEKIKQHAEMEAALAGVFTQEAAIARERFAILAEQIVKPAFDEFKLALRELGRDAVILTHLDNGPSQSICLTLCDRHLTLGPGKTIKLVNPKTDMTKVPNAKFYNVFLADSALNIGQQVDDGFGQIITQVTFDDVSTIFLENELAGFFERAYPTTAPQRK